MSSIEDYREIIKDPVLKENVKGFIDINDLESIKRNAVYAYIPIGMGYRPDLVAAHFLGDANEAWLITCINNFTNGIKDYKEGRRILIPRG